MKRDNLSIEGLRVILFLCIFLFHAWGEMFPLGWAGINTFLVITAYFLTRKYLQYPQSEMHVREALKKRAIRLYPSYLLVIIVMTALFLVTMHQLPCDFFSYFLFAQNYQIEFVPNITHVPGVGHFWYLTLDFYLLMIWLIVLKYVPRKYLKYTFLFLFLFSVVYRSICAFYVDSITLSYTMPWGMMDSFAVGGLLAIMTNGNSKAKFPWIVLLLAIVGLIFCIYTTAERFESNALYALTYYRTAKGYADSPITIQIHMVMALLSLFVVWLCICNRKHYGILSNRYLAKWGGLSYELYVFHYPILWMLSIATQNHFVIIVIGLLVTIAATMIWKRYVESIVTSLFS